MTFGGGSPPRVWGKLLKLGKGEKRPAVHPHVCGENSVNDSFFDVLPRFTPTCVGKTVATDACPNSRLVHPHVCGENSLNIQYTSQKTRFTPTCVGKTYCSAAYLTLLSGSPPRVWGKHPAPRPNSVSTRFTPTCVGKTSSYPNASNTSTVHPHVCGENGWRSAMLPTVIGSPPRVWGKRAVRGGSVAVRTVHPHVCGENTPSNTLHAVSKRFTPTCVGKTS